MVSIVLEMWSSLTLREAQSWPSERAKGYLSPKKNENVSKNNG
jgi:hypothetical protein